MNRGLDKATIYAYQSILLSEIALMRGITPLLSFIRPPDPDSNVLITGYPTLGAGLHDPERRLLLGEVIEAIFRGLERFHSERRHQGKVSAGEIAEVFVELVDRGYLIVYPRQEGSSGGRRDLLNQLIKDSINIIKVKLKEKHGLEIDPEKYEFKTYHGELARQAANASALPSRYAAVGFLVLPAILEPIPSKASEPGLPNNAKKWIKNKCKDIGDILARILEESLREAGYEFLNNYQYKIVSEYFDRRMRANGPLDVVLTAPTGAGKTLAFLIITLIEILASKCENEKRPVILVYPRKTLARDQVEDLAKILAILNDKLIEELGWRIILWLRDGSSGSVKCQEDSSGCVELPRKGNESSIRGIKIPSKSGGFFTAKHYLDENNVYVSYPEWIIDAKDDVRVMIESKIGSPEDFADIVVTNYDMVFKDTLELLRGTPTRLSKVISNAGIVVLDEAHMIMGGRQAIMVQAYSLMLQRNGRRPGIILSSATLLERMLVDPRASLRHFVGVEIHRGPDRQAALKAFTKLIGMPASDSMVYVDYYKAASSPPGGWKLTFWSIIYPSLLKKPITALNEAIVSLAHSLAAARVRWRNGAMAKAIAFIEYKSSLHDIASEITSRIVLESGDVYDRVLLPTLFDKHAKELELWIKDNAPQPHTILKVLPKPKHEGAHKEIIEVIKQIASDPQVKASDVIWHDYYKRFHSLAPYLTLEDYHLPLNTTISGAENPALLFECIVGGCILARSKKAMPKPPLSGEVWMEHMLVHASLMLKFEPWIGSKELQEYYKTIEGISKELTNFIPIVFHHGDYTGSSRHLADTLLSQANPLIIMATSTLEVGLNIPGIVATLHYILPREPGRILQMVGRSGRTPETMRVSQGIVILRQNAWESLKRIELHSFKYFNEIRSPPMINITENPYYLARLCITLGKDNCNTFNNNLNIINSSVINIADLIIKQRSDIKNLIQHLIQDKKSNKTRNACKEYLKFLSSYRAELHFRFNNSRLLRLLNMLGKACSQNQNHAVTLGIAENALMEILEIRQNNSGFINNILRELVELRAAIYNDIILNIINILNQLQVSYSRDEIINLIVHPRGFEVPGAGDPEPPTGKVVVVG